MRTLLIGICFACVILTRSHVASRDHSAPIADDVAVETKEMILSNKVATDSGAREIQCVSRKSPTHPYNYSFSSSSHSKAIKGRQWCCLTPNMRDILKVKHAPDDASKSSLASLDSIQYAETTVITGKDGSEWRVPQKDKWTWKVVLAVLRVGLHVR
jgi:hypothetical protein